MLLLMPQPEPPAPTAPSGSAATGPDDWLTPGRFALVLLALIFAAFPQVLLGLETFVIRDYGFFGYPLAYYQRECFWRGELPLWNPYNSCGVPFLAQWNTMPLYPPVLIYLMLPLTWGLSCFSLLHLFWAGFGMYFLAHRWTGLRFAAAVAGVVFAFNGFTLNLLMWPSHIATLSWMPWVILCVELGWRQGGRKLILAGLVGTLQMLAGGPETILFTWIILTALWVGQLWQSTFGGHGKKPGVVTRDTLAQETVVGGWPEEIHARAGMVMWRFPLMVVLVATLAAAQLMPFLDLASHSQREEGFADARWSMPGWGWANYLVPMVFGSTWKQNMFFQYGQYWTSSYYLGVGGLLLAVLGAWTVRCWRVWLLAGASVLGLLLAGGDENPFSHWLRRAVPQLSLMTYPVKYLTVVTFSVPLLGAFALAHWQRAGAPERQAVRHRFMVLGGVLLLVLGGILVWAWRWRFPLDEFPTTLVNGMGRALFLVLAAGLLVGVFRTSRARLRRTLPLLFLLVCWLDVWTHEPPQNPSVPGWIFTPGLARKDLAMNPQPELGHSRAMVAPAAESKFLQLAMPDPKDNFLVKRLGYFADCNLLDGVPKVNGFFSLYPRECGELNSVIYVSTNGYSEALADFMGVSQLTATNEYVKWQSRDTFMPFATAGQRPVFLDDTNALWSLFKPRFDPRKFVILPPETKSAVSVQAETQAKIISQSVGTERIDLQVEAVQPALVVVAQTYYHRWRVYVDGRPQPLLRANYAFQAVEVPGGTHEVRLRYEDHAFRAGSLVSAVALLLGLGAWWWCKPRRNPGLK
jgi:hypothetical protein